jgi:hypothetical protein
MPLDARIRAVVIVVFFLAANASAASGADQSADEWLRGSGKGLQICLKGEVFESDGRPATGVQLAGRMNATLSNEQLKPAVDGHRFKIWVPVNQPNQFSLALLAGSAHNDRVAYKTLNAYELRQAAIDGVKLTLQSPTRHKSVRVADGGQPVAGASVKADLGFGIELRSTTDENGVARFGLLPEQQLSSLTAWTDDHRIGGYGFYRKPTRDPNVAEHVVELSKCHDQKVRFVDEDGAPAPGVTFVLQIATPSPNFNFIGLTDHSQMTADAAGEAVYRWFPNWDDTYFYADIDKSPWILDGEPKMVDGVAVFKLRKSKGRKHVEGRVVSTDADTGGFFVTLQSFQGERENYSDIATAFTDATGRFTVDVLPDATYCAYVLDDRWVGNLIHVIPYESASDKIAPLELAVADGQPVEVVVTSGQTKKPLPNLSIHFRREHEYSWRENGQKRNGVGGPQWWAATDKSGRATTRTLPGKLRVSVFTPIWRTEQTVDVRGGDPVAIQLHREVEEKRTVTGRLVLDQGVTANLADAQVWIGSVDGQFDDQQSLTCGKDGWFSYDTFATQIGVFGCTRDGRAAGSVVVKEISSPIELRLRPTLNYEGQLLGEGGRPVVDHSVSALVRVEGDEDYNGRFVKYFDAKRIDARTDAEGNYTLQGVPSEMKVNIIAKSLDSATERIDLDEIYLEPNESRPRAVSRLEANARSPKKAPLAERFKTTLRDCRLAGYCPMVILASDDERITEFVNHNFVDRETNKDVYSFMQIVVSGGKTPLESTDAEFLKARNWRLPETGRVVAYGLDAEGRELDRLDIDVAQESAVGDVADFIHRTAPPLDDAEKKWAAAFAEAKQSNRRVWARVSQRYCGPCFRLSRWLDDQHDLLEKDFVMVKIDDFHDLNGKQVAERLTHGKHHGVPFHAIFDPGGDLLIDSAGPLGNIGYPSDFEGKKQLRKMLLTTRHILTDAQIDQLIASIED